MGGGGGGGGGGGWSHCEGGGWGAGAPLKPWQVVKELEDSIMQEQMKEAGCMNGTLTTFSAMKTL